VSFVHLYLIGEAGRIVKVQLLGCVGWRIDSPIQRVYLTYGVFVLIIKFIIES